MKIMCHIYPTLKCNLKCKFCYVNANREIPCTTIDFGKIATFLDDLDLAFIHIEGGEPFIDNNVFKFLSKLKYRDNISIVTNGLFINDLILDELKKQKINQLVFSVDGKESSHILLRGKCDYDLIFQNIKKSVNAGFKVTVTQTITKNNISDMEYITDFFSSMGVKSIRFGEMLEIGRGKECTELHLDEMDIDKVLVNFERIVDKYLIDVKLSLKSNFTLKNKISKKLKVSEFQCSNNGNQLSILYNGDCYSCSNMITEQEYYIGNLYQNDSKVKDFINGRRNNIPCKLKCHSHISIERA